MYSFFFFSSRRRHTRFKCDWSSDVCSSDLVGTTVAPWQLFFQQSYVIDKRITPRFMRYGRADLWIGILLVIVGAVAMMAVAAAAFAGRPEFGNFQYAGAVAAGLGKYAARTARLCFATPLIAPALVR